MQKQVSLYADPQGVITADSNATPNTLALRDASGNVAHNQSLAVELKSSAILTLAPHAVTTANTTVDATATIWPGDATGGAFTFTLPPVAGVNGRCYEFIRNNTGANNITVQGNGAELVGFANTSVLTAQGSAIQIIADSVAGKWHIRAKI